MKKFYPIIQMIIVLLCIIGVAGCQGAATYDLVILNGRIISGDGNPWFYGDIGIKKDQIVKIGSLQSSNSAKVIDAKGSYVAPGFIDIHTHAEKHITDIPAADNYLLQGVTTLVAGNCGGSFFPLSDLFYKINTMGIGVNFCSLIGHNTIRKEVMGLKMAYPTAKELTKMNHLIDQEMRSGGIGLSTGLAYMPGRYAKKEEILSLAKVVSRYGGLYASHIRDQGEKMTEAINEAIWIGEKSGLPVQISHIKLCIEKNWGQLGIINDPIIKARQRGLEVTTDQYPYRATSSGLSSSFPAWSLAGGMDELKKRLKDPEKYQEIKNHIINKRLTSIKDINTLETIYIGNFQPEKSYEGKNLAKILKMQNKKPTVDNAADLIIDIKKRGDASCVFFQMIETDINDIMQLDYNMIASDGGVIKFGDGVPHCRSYGTFPRILGLYVRDKKILSLSEAIRKMTSLPAQTLRLSRRGLIKEGFYADITIFDLKKVKDTATYQSPHQYPQGIEYVLVNGSISAQKGKSSGNLPGRILFGAGKK